MLDLKSRAMELSAGCELMIDREKGDMDKLIGTPVVINGYDFLTDSEKGTPYVVFTIHEDDAHFFFGGTVLTDKMKKLDNEGYRDAVETEGLPVLFGKNQPKDKKKKSYTTVTFYPAEQQPSTKATK